MAHPEDRPDQQVPGLEEWEYRFHGIGCCLTHRLTGERIDVDFVGDHAEGFDFYLNYLESLRQPQALSRDPHVQLAALNWERRHPRASEPRPSVSVKEWYLRHASSWLAFRMDELRERILPLADRELAAL